MGDVEFIKTRGGGNGGKDKVVRRFDPATGWKYTALVRKFFSIKRIEFVVRIAALFAGTRSNGQPYRRHGFFPVGNITLPGTTDAQRDARIKTTLKRQFPAWPTLAEYSEERITAEDAEWKITEMITNPAAAGPVTSIVDRPLGMRPVLCNVPLSDQICSEAFANHDDRQCVPRQIASLIYEDFGVICLQFDRIEQELYQTSHWTEHGATARMIV
jgi:hypothetical protein